jgi:hypothetical protein
MVVYHNYIGPIYLMNKVFFLSKMFACLSSLLGAQVVYLEVIPFVEMALCRYVFFNLGKG